MQRYRSLGIASGGQDLHILAIKHRCDLDDTVLLQTPAPYALDSLA